MRVSVNLGCGCLLAAVGLLYLASRLLGWKGLLITMGVISLVSISLPIFASLMVQKQMRRLQDAMKPPGGHEPPGEPPKHSLWVCGSCGESNAPGAACKSCGAPEQ